MNAPSKDISTYLASESSLALEFATDLFIGREPDSPTNCVTVFDTPGRPPLLDMQGDTGYRIPYVQVRVRNTDYATGWDLANDIEAFLHGKGPITISGTVYTLIRCTMETTFLDYDEFDNPRFVATYEIQRRS